MSHQKKVIIVVNFFHLLSGTYTSVFTEVKEYYECLDMDWEKDQDLRWIAIDALKAPLPEGWKPWYVTLKSSVGISALQPSFVGSEDTSTGDIYYFNFKSGESVWDHPMDDHFRDVAKREKAKKANANADPVGAIVARPKTSFGLSNENVNNAHGPR
jgi:centrosomal protein CEP164